MNKNGGRGIKKKKRKNNNKNIGIDVKGKRNDK